MLYCPNCSAYQYDRKATICRKCGFDMASHEKEMANRERQSAENLEKAKHHQMKRFDAELECPICKAPSRKVDEDMELIHEGSRMKMKGVKVMGGEITKKTQTLYQVHLIGLECSEGHRSYMDVTFRMKPICPMCTEPMIEYGSSLFSCTKCKEHFARDEWDKPTIEEVLSGHGWQKVI